MPVTPPLSYPGVYIQELPSGVRTIVGVPTSITAFLGRAPRGPVNEPVTVTNFGDIPCFATSSSTSSLTAFRILLDRRRPLITPSSQIGLISLSSDMSSPIF